MKPGVKELIEGYTEQGLLKDPVIDIGGNSDSYQIAQGYNWRKYFADRGLKYYIQDTVMNDGVDFCADASTMTIVNKAYRPRTILLTDMLEHCESPKAIVDNCWKLLKDKGIIIVVVPDMYGVHSDKDYWRFNESGLKYLCRNFTELQFGHFGSEERRCLDHYFVGRKDCVSAYPKIP